MYVFTSHNLLSRNYVSIATRTNSHRTARLDDVPKTQTAALLIERDTTRQNPPSKLRDRFRIIDATKQYLPRWMQQDR